MFNFIALAIIAEFDEYVLASMKGETYRCLIEERFLKKVIVIQHTSSKKCGETDLSKVKDENGEFRPLKIKFI